VLTAAPDWFFASDGAGGAKSTLSVGGVELPAVGDSYTHGGCVPPGTEFVGLIREQYARTLNLGMRGSGPLLELAQIKEYLLALKPTIVLWFYYEGNDLSNLNIEKRSALLRRYLEDRFTLPLLDLYPAFRAERDPLAFFPFRRFGHYNENGNRFVATVLQKALRALLPGQARADFRGRARDFPGQPRDD
jgi:hypothetical protein